MRYVDFTIQVQQECTKTAEGPRHFSLSTYEQTVDLMNPATDYCGCKGFAFRSQCKHVAEARQLAEKENCGWNEFESDVTQTVQQEFDMKCPRCGSSTRIVRVAV